jgi:hypothetical protein
MSSGHHHHKIFIASRGLRFGKTFEVTFEGGCIRSTHCDVDFVISDCAFARGLRKNNQKLGSSWFEDQYKFMSHINILRKRRWDRSLLLLGGTVG